MNQFFQGARVDISTSIISNTQAFLTHLQNPTNFTPTSCDFFVGWNIHSRPRKKSPKTTVNIFQLSCWTSKSLFSPPILFKTSPNHYITLQHQNLVPTFFLGGGRKSTMSTSNIFFVAASGSRLLRVDLGIGAFCLLVRFWTVRTLSPLVQDWMDIMGGWAEGCRWKPQEIVAIYFESYGDVTGIPGAHHLSRYLSWISWGVLFLLVFKFVFSFTDFESPWTYNTRLMHQDYGSIQKGAMNHRFDPMNVNVNVQVFRPFAATNVN